MAGSETSDYANTRQPDNFRIDRRPSLDRATVGCISETRVDAIGVVVGDVVAEEPAKGSGLPPSMEVAAGVVGRSFISVLIERA